MYLNNYFTETEFDELAATFSALKSESAAAGRRLKQNRHRQLLISFFNFFFL